MKTSADYTEKHTIPWIESQGFTIISNEERDNSVLDQKYNIDYVALDPTGKKVALMVKGYEYKPSSEFDYVFTFRTKCLKTNRMREYWKLQICYKDWTKSKVYNELGIQDYVAVQSFYDKSPNGLVARCFAYTSFQSILNIVDAGLYETYTLGGDKPAEFIKVKFKELRLHGYDLVMDVFKPHRFTYHPKEGFYLAS